MIYKTSLLVFSICALLSCNRVKEKVVSKTPVFKSYHSTSHLIEAEEVIALSEAENIKIIDFRKEEEYLKGHIPKALNIWRSDIEDSNYPYKGMSANRASIEKVLQGLGIEEGDIVIAYDDMGLCDATRLWWVLKTYNFNTVKLLNGGWQAWNGVGGVSSKEIPEVVPSDIKLSAFGKKEMYIGVEDVSKLFTEENQAVLLDTRTTDEYSGKRLKKGAVRSGRIPKSRHIDWENAIDKGNMQKFKTVVALEKIYVPLIDSKNTPIVAYCHTGVRSAHTTFVLTELLGYTNVKNYDGSWSEWSYFNDLPIEKDSITSIY